MSETADILHHVPGRVRLRLVLAKRKVEKLREIQQALEGIAGVQTVDANPVTGTIVIQYHPGLFAEFPGALATYASEQGLFEIRCGESIPSVSEADRSLNRVLGEVNRKVQQAMGNAVNLKELLPFALGAYGLFFVERSVAALQWLNWIQVAFDTYFDLHEDEPVAELGLKLEALGAQILDQQTTASESIQRELEGLRAEVRRLADTLHAAGPVKTK